jgi:FixJ family two-component response regulator
MVHDPMMPLDIVVVDDDPAVLDALTTILEIEGFQIRAFKASDAFLAVADTIRPDCLLLDVHMPERSGLDVLAMIGGAHYPAPVIMISGQGDIPMAIAAVKAGAHDFIEKPFDVNTVIARVREAVRAFRQRGAPAGRGSASRRFPGAETLTLREMQVLEEIVQGESNKQSGRHLGISPRTVEVHRARIMEKLAARNTADLMRIVLSSGS